MKTATTTTTTAASASDLRAAGLRAEHADAVRSGEVLVTHHLDWTDRHGRGRTTLRGQSHTMRPLLLAIERGPSQDWVLLSPEISHGDLNDLLDRDLSERSAAQRSAAQLVITIHRCMEWNVDRVLSIS
jgi:hypothetical protein